MVSYPSDSPEREFAFDLFPFVTMMCNLDGFVLAQWFFYWNCKDAIVVLNATIVMLDDTPIYLSFAVVLSAIAYTSLLVQGMASCFY